MTSCVALIFLEHRVKGAGMDEEKCWRSTEGPVISKREDTMDSRGRKAT